MALGILIGIWATPLIGLAVLLAHYWLEGRKGSR